jgi:hypothetical protein
MGSFSCLKNLTGSLHPVEPEIDVIQRTVVDQTRGLSLVPYVRFVESEKRGVSFGAVAFEGSAALGWRCEEAQSP